MNMRFVNQKADMRSASSFFLCLLTLVTLLASTESAPPSHSGAAFNRSLFPSAFLFGIGSSAYQVLTSPHKHIFY